MSAESEFNLRPLGELCEVTGGNSAPQGEEYFRGGTIPFVRMRDLGGYHHTTCLDTTRDAVTPATVEKMRLKIFEPGCILFPRSGSVQLNHRAILAIRACIVSHIGILKQFSEDIEIRYLYWFLVRYDMGVIAKQTTGLDLVGFSDVKKISIPVPATRAEQRRIVAEIEKQFTRLEAGVAAFRRVQANLKRYRAAVLKAACEGRLVPQEPNEKPVDIPSSGRLQPISDSEIPFELPDSWRWCRLGNTAELINGDRGKNYPNRAEYVSEGLPFINTGHIEPNGTLSLETMHYLTRAKFDSLRSGKIRKGDLVYCLRGATIGKTAIISQFSEGAVASSLVIIRLTSGLDRKYAYYYLTSRLGRQLIKRFDNGSAQPNLAANSVKRYVVPIPPLAEQTRIVAEVERRLSVVEELESVVTANLQRATRLRQSILQKAFTGQLT